jgi:hypothetical protein
VSRRSALLVVVTVMMWSSCDLAAEGRVRPAVPGHRDTRDPRYSNRCDPVKGS